MGAFWAKQPNGKWCRFSGIVDCITDYNCEKEDILNSILKRTKEQFEYDFEKGRYNYPFDDVIERFMPNNMSLEEAISIFKEIGASETDIEKLTKRTNKIIKEMEEEPEEDN